MEAFKELSPFNSLVFTVLYLLPIFFYLKTCFSQEFYISFKCIKKLIDTKNLLKEILISGQCVFSPSTLNYYQYERINRN